MQHRQRERSQIGILGRGQLRDSLRGLRSERLAGIHPAAGEPGQRLEAGHVAPLLGVQEQTRGQILAHPIGHGEEPGGGSVVRPGRSPPFIHTSLKPEFALVGMAGPARAHQPQAPIQSRPGDGDRMVGAGERNGVADLRMLQVRHMTGDAATARRPGRVESVRLRVGGLGGMAGCALAVVGLALQRSPVDVPVPQAVRLVAAHAGHAAVDIARRRQMRGLVGERPDATVRQVGIVAQHRELQRMVVRQRRSRQVALLHDVRQRVAGEADLQRRLHTVGYPALQADVPIAGRSRGHHLDMLPCRTVAGFAVDVQGRPACRHAPSRLEARRDLAAVAGLAVREARVRSENPGGRPVAAVREGHVSRNRRPSTVRARGRVAEPGVQLPGVVEGQEANRPVGQPRDEPLRAAAQHVAAADHAVHGDDAVRAAVLADEKQVAPLGVDVRSDRAIEKGDRGAVEGGNHGFRRRQPPRAAVRGRSPARVLVGVASATRAGACEVVRCDSPRLPRHCAALVRSRVVADRVRASRESERRREAHRRPRRFGASGPAGGSRARAAPGHSATGRWECG